MVPFPEPGAPTMRAQILPPLAAVDEFLLLDDEALEAGDPHQNTRPQRGGRLTRDDSIAIVREEWRGDLLKANTMSGNFTFLRLSFHAHFPFPPFTYRLTAMRRVQ